jgi:hypothetical protein
MAGFGTPRDSGKFRCTGTGRRPQFPKNTKKKSLRKMLIFRASCLKACPQLQYRQNMPKNKAPLA